MISKCLERLLRGVKYVSPFRNGLLARPQLFRNLCCDRISECQKKVSNTDMAMSRRQSRILFMFRVEICSCKEARGLNEWRARSC